MQKKQAVWVWDRPQQTRGQNRKQKGKRIPNTVAPDSQRRSWDMWTKEYPHEAALGR